MLKRLTLSLRYVLDISLIPGTIGIRGVIWMFGNDVRELRLRCGLTQKELGIRCGMTASAIGMIEQGRRLPSQTLYARMQDTFASEGYRMPPRPHKAAPRHDIFSLLREPLDN